MNTFVKKLLAFMLAFVLAVTPVVVPCASAYEAYTVSCPCIRVVGLMNSDILADKNDPESETVWPVETDKIVKAVFKILPSVFRLVLTHNYNKFADKLIPTLNGVLGDCYLTEAGEAKGNSGAYFKWPDASEITKTSELWFDYDWRVDPIETAAALNDFINYVLECSGSEQVVIECHSFGGVVTYTYAGLYGTEKVKSFLFNASAVYGETFTGDLCEGKLHIYPEALTEYLKGAWAYESSAKFLNGLFSVLLKSGFTGWLCGKINKIVDKTHDRLYKETIYPMFGYWPSIWSMVTDEYYDEAYDYVFNGVFKDDGIDHSGLKQKVDNFTDKIRNHRVEILENINETSNLYVVCRTGWCSMFCTPSWEVANDMIVDVSCASFGATAAPYGKTLDSDYIASKKPEYISPAGNIDASTCLFPEQTWFVDNANHMRHFDSLNEMFDALLYYDGQATVDTYDEYPRFLHLSSEDRSLSPAK